MNGSLPELDEPWAIFLDVDGTLVDLTPTPDGAVVGEELVTLLRRLHARLDGALALVSGRPLADLDRMFTPLALPVAGVHGAERRNASGEMESFDRRPPTLDRAVEELRDLTRSRPGVLVEDKGAAVAVHYRLAPQAEPEVRRSVEAQVALLGTDYCVQPGKMILEVRPVCVDKGQAVERFMSEVPFVGRLPVYAGDDVTDEDAFETVNHMGGHSIHVGSNDTTAACWRIGSVSEFGAWLVSIAQSASRVT